MLDKRLPIELQLQLNSDLCSLFTVLGLSSQKEAWQL